MEMSTSLVRRPARCAVESTRTCTDRLSRISSPSDWKWYMMLEKETQTQYLLESELKVVFRKLIIDYLTCRLSTRWLTSNTHILVPCAGTSVESGTTRSSLAAALALDSSHVHISLRYSIRSCSYTINPHTCRTPNCWRKRGIHEVE